MIFDIVVLAAVFLSCAIAFLRGFIREVLTILGVAGGAVAAWYAGKPLTPIILDWLQAGESEPGKLFDTVPYPVVANALAHGSVFIIVVIVLSVLSHNLSGWARSVGLGTLDRSLGIVFGLGRAVVLLALFYLPVYMLVSTEQRDELFKKYAMLKDSKTRLYVEEASAFAVNMLPESVKNPEQNKDDLVAGTKEKLQELDILMKGDEATEPGSGDVKDADTGKTGPGYGPGERRDIQDLITSETTDE